MIASSRTVQALSVRALMSVPCRARMLRRLRVPDRRELWAAVSFSVLFQAGVTEKGFGTTESPTKVQKIEPKETSIKVDPLPVVLRPTPRVTKLTPR